MSRSLLFVANLLMALLLLAAPITAVAAAPSGSGQVLVRIVLAGQADDSRALAQAPLELLALESTAQTFALARADRAGLDWLQAGGYDFQVLDDHAEAARYLLVDLAGALAGQARSGQVIYSDGLLAVRRVQPDEPVAFDLGVRPLDQPMQLIERQPLRLPASVTPIPEVEQILDQVTLPRLLTYANELSGETPASIAGQPYTIATRYTYSGQPVQMAVSYMVERLQRLGLTVTTPTWNPSYPPNIIAEKPGLDPAAGITIIGAHLDSISGSAMTLAPGADDNGSGSVAVLLAAEILAPYNFDATLRFVLFTGEEQGLYGSTAYANSVAGQDLRGMLNMDMIAWDSQGGPDMDIHSRSSVPGNTALANLYADVISAYQLPLTPVVYGNGIPNSDHSPFWNINVPAILAIENHNSDPGIPADFNAYYHTTNDRTQAFNNGYFRAMTQASLATYAHMSGLRTDCYWADLNCSGAVDALDISRAAAAWQAQRYQWNYSPVYDADSDGHIDVVDIQRFASEWGWAG